MTSLAFPKPFSTAPSYSRLLSPVTLPANSLAAHVACCNLSSNDI